MQQQTKEKTIPLTRDDFIFLQLRELKDSMRDLNVEIRETRKEINARMDKLENRMDRLENEMRSTARHSQIMAGSVVAIALGVLYFVFTH